MPGRHIETQEDEVCVLDRQKLATLQALIGKDKAAVAIQKFKQELDMLLPAIAAPSTSTAEKGAYAHKLVGTAGSIGFHELSVESRRFEEAVKKSPADVEAPLRAFLSAAARAKAELERLT